MTKIKNPLKGDQVLLPLVRSCKKCTIPTESPILDQYCPQCFDQLTKNVPTGMCSGWYDPNDKPTPFWHQPIFFNPQTMQQVDVISQKFPNPDDELGNFSPPAPGRTVAARKINKLWVGSIECKIIKGKSFYYWRHRKRKNFGDSTLTSRYLGSTWTKCLKSLDRLQSQRMRE